MEKDTKKNNGAENGDNNEIKQTMYRIINKEKKNSILNMELELPFEFLEGNRNKAIEILGKDLEIKGFRKGFAPKNLVAEQIGEMKILEESAYQSIVQIIPDIIKNEEINVLTQPNVSIQKMAPNNPLVFKIDFVLMPEIELPDYKKIARSIKRIDQIEVTEKEINDYIDYIRSSKMKAEDLKKKTSGKSSQKKEVPEKEAVDVAPENTTGLPEFNDDFVKSLGDFKNVSDFKQKLKDNMLAEKKSKESQKRRIEIIEEIIKETKADLPDIIVAEELQRMLAQFKDDIKRAKMDFDEYLAQIKKTEGDLLKEWRPDAQKRAKMNLILPKIAVQEKIEADQEMVKHEVDHLKKHYPDISDNQALSYVSHVLQNEEVFKFLENIK